MTQMLIEVNSNRNSNGVYVNVDEDCFMTQPTLSQSVSHTVHEQADACARDRVNTSPSLIGYG